MDESGIISRLKQGDINALEVLVRQYQVPAVHAAYLITQNRALAEEIVQSAFLLAFEHIDQFNPSYPFKPWFMRIVLNESIKSVTQNKREVSIDSSNNTEGKALIEILVDPTPSMDDRVEFAELREAVLSAIDKLPPSQRVVIVMRYYLGFDGEEIAEVLDRPLGTVKWRLHAGRKRIRSFLTDKDSALKAFFD